MGVRGRKEGEERDSVLMLDDLSYFSAAYAFPASRRIH